MEPHRIGFQTDALLAPGQALEQYFSRAQLRPPQTEYVPLERALGRVLAARVYSDRDYPAAPRSAMDGFAVRSAETPGRLRIAGEIRMGQAWPGQMPAGTALRIPTGGMVPSGADAVVPVEDAAAAGEFVEIGTAVPGGDCVTPAASDMRAGEVLVEPGRRIGGPEMGLLATLGMTAVPVYKRPLFAVLSSGDELVETSAEPGPAQIRDSNRWAVAGTLEALGAAVRHFPIAPDEPGRLEVLLREAVATADAVVLTGGSSVGERDLTPRIVDRLGTPGVLVHGLRVKPGKPTVLACADGKPVIGLPGNPASALMILEAVVSPIVRALCGGAPHQARVECRLGAAYAKRPGWTWYVPVRLQPHDGALSAFPLELRSSSVSLLARASGFIELGEHVERLEAGTAVTVTRFSAGGER